MIYDYMVQIFGATDNPIIQQLYLVFGLILVFMFLRMFFSMIKAFLNIRD